MTLQIELLESSFQAIAPQGGAFVTAFYERLFTSFPQTRAFFASTDMKEQRKKLLGALALVIQNLRKPEVLTSALQGLGQRHVTYGVSIAPIFWIWEQPGLSESKMWQRPWQASFSYSMACVNMSRKAPGNNLPPANAVNIP